MLELNKVYNCDCIAGLKQLPDESIDLTITSPPYDNLRKYKGYTWDFEATAKELYRITKQGGVVVWVVNDGTKNGSETGTSFKQALFFKDCGFNLHDTMIWFKPNAMPQVDRTRYTQSFEYMFIFTKGKPKTVNLKTVPTKHSGKVIKTTGENAQSIIRPTQNRKNGGLVQPARIAFNVFEYVVTGTNYGHPAIFPLQLALDHITTWSNEGDIVLDPFIGSGTSAVAALQTNRNFIGFEISGEYCGIAENRINDIKRNF